MSFMKGIIVVALVFGGIAPTAAEAPGDRLPDSIHQPPDATHQSPDAIHSDAPPQSPDATHQPPNPTRQPPEPTTFLQRLAGEWSVVTEAIPGPGREPVRSESRQRARMVGRWLVAEATGTAPGGRPYTSILTLGFDPSAEHFIGTWIDSMQAHRWMYTGRLDDSGTALTLETEGPVLGDPTTLARYREIIEIEDTDRVVMRSMILGPNGEWFEFARAEYRRLDG
jgi:hypothetical protein